MNKIKTISNKYVNNVVWYIFHLKGVMSVFFVLFFFISQTNAQTTFQELNQQIKTQNITLKQVSENRSLLGKHITYACYFNGIELKNIYLKQHFDKKNGIYLEQENISKLTSLEVKNTQYNKENILLKLKENLKVSDVKEVYIQYNESVFQKALQVNIIDEWQDVYIERTYFSETEFTDRNLKVHFAPIDTTIIGSVFLPNPLTSAEEDYGNNYQDSFTKDTLALIIKTIPNVGQSSVITGIVSYTLFGQTFNVDNQNVTNDFSGANVYFVFDEIYLDVNKNIQGYNSTLVDDLTGFQTKLITEDYNYAELDAEQFQVEVKGDFVASEFRLQNSVFEMRDFSLPVIAPYTSTVNDFTFSRSDKAFEDINIFYHLNNMHSYIESLGYTDLDAQKIKIDAHGNSGADNSFFTNLPTPRLIFGDGGVDDGEDASVIIHEYTHALSYFASPNTNIGKERQSLDEALGDYFSSSYSSVYSDFNIEKVFPWDGHNEFWSGRFSNSDSTYMALDLGKTIYYNAQIMSATFMDIFGVLGKEITDKLVLETMYLNTSNNTFQDVANNLLLVDSLYFDNAHKCEIFNVLVDRKFKEGLCIGNKIVEDNGFYVIGTESFSSGNSNAEFYIVEENFETMDVWISNSLGQIVFKQKNIKEPKLILSPNSFLKGVYYIRFQTNNNKHNSKLLKL